VHVLRAEVVAQHFGGTRMAGLAAQSGEKGAARVVPARGVPQPISLWGWD